MALLEPRARVLHDDLTTWFFRNHPHADAMLVVSVLCYEVGVRIGQASEHAVSNTEISSMVSNVAMIMATQIREHLIAAGKYQA